VRSAGLRGRAFVGRAGELGELERALDAARAGGGATVLVAGEAGIGKTRLASELAARARDAGFEVLLGRSIDLVGTELPYQPFVEALQPLAELRRVDGQVAGSQRRVFEKALALLTDRAAARPALLVLEDLHWADTSSLDLVVFLAHNLDGRRVLLLAIYRADDLSSAQRVRRFAAGVRRSGSAYLLELGPLEREEICLGPQGDTSPCHPATPLELKIPCRANSSSSRLALIVVFALEVPAPEAGQGAFKISNLAAGRTLLPNGRGQPGGAWAGRRRRSAAVSSPVETSSSASCSSARGPRSPGAPSRT
jgi:hypothetical protein